MSPSSPLNFSRFSADEFATHFATKIDKIRAATASAPSPVIDLRTVAEKIWSFDPVTTDEITRLLSRSPAKHCLLDPVPTWLLKRASDILAPVLSVMCNASMQSGKFPDIHKQATVFPRLKKPTLDAYDANSYRPISNLSFVSKLVERAVATRLVKHAENNKLFPNRQSAYRRHHSTETAVVCVMNDIIRSIDRGEITALVLLDLTAAFDTVDHQTLIDVLHRRFAIDGVPLSWFESYLTNRMQSFTVDGVKSVPNKVSCGVPQGSVLGPLEFIAYTEEVTMVFCRNQVSRHLIADDKQIYHSCLIEQIYSVRKILGDCVLDIRDCC